MNYQTIKPANHQTGASERRRNASIELYRLLLMLGICALHVVTFAASVDRAMLRYGAVPMFSVDAFVVVAGYFGCRFSIAKIVKLLSVLAGCVLTVFAVASICGHEYDSPIHIEFVSHLKQYWFLNAYLALMFLAPVLNAAFPLDQKPPVLFLRAAPFLFLAFGWDFARNFNLGRRIFFPIPGCPGSCGHSLLTFAGCYVAGRLARACENAALRIPLRIHGMVLGVCAIAAVVVADRNIFAYNSPLCLAMAISSLALVKSFDIPGKAGKTVNFLAVSVFPVYLLHCNDFGLDCLRKLTRHLWDFGLRGFVLLFAAAFIVFAVALAADLPRRAAVWLLKNNRFRANRRGKSRDAAISIA